MRPGHCDKVQQPHFNPMGGRLTSADLIAIAKELLNVKTEGIIKSATNITLLKQYNGSP
jgi:hypothetical protein